VKAIDYWANQDPDGTKKKAAEARKKEEMEKAQKAEEESLLQQRMEEMDPLEMRKLRHQAISEVVQGKEKEKHVEDANALEDFDDADGGMDEWENTDQYAKYMA